MKLPKPIKRLFSNIFLKDKQYLSKRYSYYLSFCEKYSDLKILADIINPKRNNSVNQTDLLITFKETVNFGGSRKSIIKKLGNPFIKFNNKSLKNHTIYIHKYYIGNYKTTLETHFLNNKFFMGVLNFNHIKDKNKIKHMLANKYLPNTKINIHQNFSIEDKFGNSIQIQDGVIYSILYLSGNKLIKNEILNNTLYKKTHKKDIKRKVNIQLLRNL